MVLLAGGWTRRRTDGSPIVSNRVLYTLTRLDGEWGIQARFGIDSFDDAKDRSAQSGQAIESVDARFQASRSGDLETWLTGFHFPLTAVLAPGRVEVFEGPAQLRDSGEIWACEVGSAPNPTGAVFAGTTGVLLAQQPDPDSEGRCQAALVANRNGAWKTLALTLLE